MTYYRRDTKDKPKLKDPEVPSISKGHMTLKVPLTVFRENRERLVLELRKLNILHAIIIIKAAGAVRCIDKNTDVQDSKFFWAFGYQKSGAIGAIDVFSNKSYLILPRLNINRLEWCEKTMLRRGIQKHFLVNGVWYFDELESFLEFMNKYAICKECLILDYQKKELSASISNFHVHYHILDEVMTNLMAHKTTKEIKILQYIAKYLEDALIYIIHRLRPGMTYSLLEAWFNFHMTYQSYFEQLTFSIFSGRDLLGFTSHRRHLFGSKGNRKFKEGELCVIKAGAAYFGQGLSLGIVLPVSERFNSVQESAYEAVLQVRSSICRKLKVGLSLDDIRRMAEYFLLTHLISVQLLRGTVEGAYRNGLGKLLIPHSVIRSLETSCEVLEDLKLERAYTLHSECNFHNQWMDEAYKDEILKQYLSLELRSYEGIVVEVSDPIVITNDGFKFLSNMPRNVSTINDMRLIDRSERREGTIKLEKEHLEVSSSKFSL